MILTKRLKSEPWCLCSHYFIGASWWCWDTNWSCQCSFLGLFLLTLLLNFTAASTIDHHIGALHFLGYGFPMPLRPHRDLHSLDTFFQCNTSQWRIKGRTFVILAIYKMDYYKPLNFIFRQDLYHSLSYCFFQRHLRRDLDLQLLRTPLSSSLTSG